MRLLPPAFGVAGAILATLFLALSLVPPRATGWSTWQGSVLLTGLWLIACLGLAGSLLAPRRPGLALPFLIVAGGSYIVGPLLMVGVWFLLGALVCAVMLLAGGSESLGPRTARRG